MVDFSVADQTNPDLDAYPKPNSDRHTDSDSVAHAHTVTDRHPDSDLHPNADAHTHQHINAHTDPTSVSNSDANRHLASRSIPHRHAIAAIANINAR